MRNKKNIIILLIFCILLFPIKTYANENTEHLSEDYFDLNKKNIEDFISEEIVYMETDLTKNILYKEITLIEKCLKEIMDNYYLTSSGVKVYSGETSKKIHALQNARYNRWQKIKKIDGREDNIVFNKYFTHVYKPTYEIVGEISSEKQSKNFNAVIDVMENIKINNDLIDGLHVYISPYELKDVNGFAFSGGTTGNHKHEAIALVGNGNQSIYNTILHEIGHIVSGRLSEKKNKNILNEEYINLFSEEHIESSSYKWDTSISESFAEDFRVIFSKRLGELSFSPSPKRTIYPETINAKKYILKETISSDEYNLIEKQLSLPFNDINYNLDTIDPIYNMYTKGIIKGVESNKLAPHKGLSRAELAQMLDRIMDGSHTENNIETKISFNDVKKNQWFYKSINNMYVNGFMNGKSNKYFAPYDMLSKEEAIVVIMRVLESFQVNNKSNNEKKINLNESNLSSWSKPYIEQALIYNILNEEELFDIKNNISRIDTIILLDSLDKLIQQKSL